MPDPNAGIVAGIGAAIVAGVVGLTKWLLDREVARNDALHEAATGRINAIDERVDTIERTAVTQAGVDAAVARIERAVIESGKQTHDSLKAVHQRIDRLYETGLVRRSGDS